MEAKSGEGEEGAHDPERGMMGSEDKDEEEIDERNGGEGAGDEGSDVMVGAEESDDEGKN